MRWRWKFNIYGGGVQAHRVIERLHAAEQAGMAGGAGHAAAQSLIVPRRDLA